MSISDQAIKRPISVFVLTIAVVVMGLFFFQRLSVDLLPRITYPMIRVIIDWKGAGPEEIEENVLKKIEATAATTEDAIQVDSSATQGNATIEVYFEFGKDMDVALADTRAKLDLVRNQLPKDIEEPKIYKADPSMLPIIEIVFFSKQMDERNLRDWVENHLSNHFLGIPGLGAVVTSGGKIREIQIIFDQAVLQKFELSTNKILQVLELANLEVPAGRIVNPDKDFSIRLLAKFKNVEDITQLVIANREGRLIRVKDVAEVIDTHEEQRVITRFNGKPCVNMSFLKQPNANTVTVVSKINKQLHELKKKKIIPENVNYGIASNQAHYIENSIKNVAISALLGALLAVLIIWFFLHNINRTLIISIAVPVSIVGTFTLMHLFGVTLNIFSLGGLVLAVGLLVDNSVVMLENITRHQENTVSSIEGSHIGSKEILTALIASTLTNIVVIGPFFFMEGISSLLFRDMVITVSVAFVISLIVCLAVVPSWAAHLYDKQKTDKSSFSKTIFKKIIAHYKSILNWVLHHRFLVLAIVIALLITSFFLFKSLGKQFLPQIDDGKLKITLQMPVGTPLSKTNNIVNKVERILKKIPSIESVYSMVGGYWKKRNVYEKSNEAEIYLELVDRSKRSLSTKKVIQMIRKKLKMQDIPNAKFKVMRSRLRGIKKNSLSDIEVRVRGPNLDKLFMLANQIKAKVEKVPGIMNLDLSVDLSRPEMHIYLDRKKLNYFELNVQEVSQVLKTFVDGVVATQYTDESVNIDYDIRLLAPPSLLQQKEDLENIYLYPSTGVKVKLKEVGKVVISEGPVQIDRQNQVRVVSVLADVLGENIGKVTDKVKAQLEDLQLPQGYFLEFGGEEESQKESYWQLLIVIILAIFLLFVVLAVQYDALIDP
ncbi:MAG: efflux RND transporter permease subunit, partial [Bacteriovoracia bacterium]